MAELALAAIDRILRKAGAERVSAGAKKELRRVTEDIGMEIAEESVRIAQHAGRKTVKAEDIRLAAR